jgi:hypothetical protein
MGLQGTSNEVCAEKICRPAGCAAGLPFTDAPAAQEWLDKHRAWS